MSASYLKLWKLLIDKGLKKTDLIIEAGISTNVLAKLGKDDYISIGKPGEDMQIFRL